MDWNRVQVQIAWTRCKRRRWPAAARLALTPEERRKRRQVLLYYWAGHGRRSLPTGEVDVTPGTCFWSRPGWDYACTQDPADPLGVTAIHFDLVRPDGRLLELPAAALPPEQLRVRDVRLVDAVTRWLAERALDVRGGVALAAAEKQAANSMFRGLLMQLDHDTGSGAEPAWHRWADVTDYIQASLPDAPGVTELARHFGYTRSHFSRLFRQRVGLAPQAYLINARTALAKELLRETALNVTSVAAHAGYGDVFRFSRQFKQQTGQNPSAYRRRTVDRP